MRYIIGMAKVFSVSDVTVRDSKTGQFVTVRGAGALKGHIKLIKGVDLTKPIASQAAKGGQSRKSGVTKKH